MHLQHFACRWPLGRAKPVALEEQLCTFNTSPVGGLLVVPSQLHQRSSYAPSTLRLQVASWSCQASYTRGVVMHLQHFACRWPLGRAKPVALEEQLCTFNTSPVGGLLVVPSQLHQSSSYAPSTLRLQVASWSCQASYTRGVVMHLQHFACRWPLGRAKPVTLEEQLCTFNTSPVGGLLVVPRQLHQRSSYAPSTLLLQVASWSCQASYTRGVVMHLQHFSCRWPLGRAKPVALEEQLCTFNTSPVGGLLVVPSQLHQRSSYAPTTLRLQVADPTTSYDPQHNVKIERMHRCLKNSLRARLGYRRRRHREKRHNRYPCGRLGRSQIQQNNVPADSIRRFGIKLYYRIWRGIQCRGYHYGQLV